MKIFNKKIKENFDYEFEVEVKGLYAIEIIASCKSWWQNVIKFTSFFKDDDLTIKINNIEFPKLNGKRGLFDGEVAWNGNNLKGLKKINIFLIKLENGNHFIHFIIDQGPYLESVNIYKFQNSKNIFYTPESNHSPEDGNRRQWLNIILVNLPLKNLSLTASAGKRGGDDDDLKLIVDGEIEKNAEAKSHTYWHWCGRTLESKQKEFHKEINLPQGLHYIELWADRTPVLHQVSFDLEEKTPIRLKDYTYKGVSGKEDYNRFDREIIESVTEWNNEFLEQDYPPTEPLDPNLVKAMVYIESRMGYEKGGYPDVIQVGNENDPALHTLNNDGWIDPRTGKMAREYEWQNGQVEALDYKGEANTRTPPESIKWGVRWLYHKAQEIKEDQRVWRDWKEAVDRYGPGTEEYGDTVWRVYQEGVLRQGIKLWSILLILFFVLAITFGSWFGLNQGRTFVFFENIKKSYDYNIVAKVVDGLWFKKVLLANVYPNGGNFLALGKDKQIDVEYLDIDNDGQKEIIITGSRLGWKTIKYILESDNNKFKRIQNIDEYGGLHEAFSSEQIFFGNIDDDKELEVIEKSVIRYENAPDQIWNLYYDLAENGIYKFVKMEKIDIADS